MLKLSRALAASALMTLALSACASIETRDLPKCSGHDRRPLNADLWTWEHSQPRAPSDTHRSDPSMGFAPTEKPQPAALDRINNLASVDEPRWDMAASEASCG